MKLMLNLNGKCELVRDRDNIKLIASLRGFCNEMDVPDSVVRGEFGGTWLCKRPGWETKDKVKFSRTDSGDMVVSTKAETPDMQCFATVEGTAAASCNEKNPANRMHLESEYRKSAAAGFKLLSETLVAVESDDDYWELELQPEGKQLTLPGLEAKAVVRAVIDEWSDENDAAWGVPQ
jgi:hypothetical protein